MLNKFKKEDEETEEEIENNKLREIYEFREGLKQIGVATDATRMSDAEILNKIIEEKESEKIEQKTNVLPNNINTEENVEMSKTMAIDNQNIIKEKEEQYIKLEDISSIIISEKTTSENTQSIDTNEVRQAIKESKIEENINPEFEQMYKKTFGVEPSGARKKKEEESEKIDISKEFQYTTTDNMNVLENKATYIPEKQYKFIGIAFSTYIIIEIKGEMYIIDQHAAHERIMYEKVKQNYYSEENKDSQILLLPDIVTLTNKEMQIAKENSELFKKAGFAFEDFGENTIKLIEVPSMCEKLNTKQLFLDILDEIDTVAITATQEKEEKFIATVACKSAVKANMKLDEKEVDNLMNKLLKLENPFTCPHGRPTAIKMSKIDIEKKFSRR